MLLPAPDAGHTPDLRPADYTIPPPVGQWPAHAVSREGQVQTERFAPLSPLLTPSGIYVFIWSIARTASSQLFTRIMPFAAAS